MMLLLNAALVADLYLARWNTSSYGDDTSHFIQVYRSTDHGVTWEFLSNVGHNGQGYITSDFGLGITYDPTNGFLYLIALCHYYEHTPFVGTEVFRSTDGGYTWQSAHDFHETYSYATYDYATADISYDPVDHSLMCYYFSENTRSIRVWKSEDNGATWSELTGLVTDMSGQDIEGDMVALNNGKIIVNDWFSNWPVIYRSTDGGTSWVSRAISSDDNNVSARSVAIAYTSGRLFSLVWSSHINPKIYTSTDWGDSWSLLHTIPIGGCSDDGCCALEAEDGLLYAVFWDASLQCSVFRSSDLGVSWNFLSQIPRHEPWYSPASALTLTTTRVEPVSIKEINSSHDKSDLLVISGRGHLTLKTKAPELSPSIAYIYSSDGRLIKTVSLYRQVSVPLHKGVYWIIVNQLAKTGVVY